MGKPRRRLTAYLLALSCCLGLPSASIASPASAEKSPWSTEFRVGLEAQPSPGGEQQPALRGVAYEIDVYGGMATGVLVQEFANTSESEQVFVYRISAGESMEFARLHSESYGRFTEIPLAALEEEAVKPRGKQKRKSREQSAVSEPFDALAEEPVILRTGFQVPIPLEGRVFRLTLPSVQDERSVVAPAGATPGESTAPVPARITVTVHHEEPLQLARSGSHEILVDFAGDRTVIETVRSEVPADRPFELEFALNSKNSPTAAGYIRRGEDGRNAVEALVIPPEVPGDGSARPKQMLFVIDTSGSMAREDKMVQARRAVSSCVEKLKSVDRFNIIEFDTDFTMMAPAPVGLTEFGTENVTRWLDQLKADQGTKLLPALEATLEQPDDPDRHRMIVVVTDGIVSDEAEVLKVLEAKLGERRLFAVGTGKQIRQETLLRLAEYGRGAATFAGDADSLEVAVTELFDSISQPLGWDVDVEWADANVEQIQPSRLPDLYAGRPVRVMAWFDGDLPSALRLKMSTVDGEQWFDVKLPPRN